MEKIAIIDLGSNSARLALVNVMEGGYFAVFDELRENIRLVQDLDWDGFLKPAKVAQTVRTLRMFRRLCDANHVDKIFAYATAAVRRAKNQKSFLDEIAVTCGIKLKVLTAEEEAHMVYQGVVNSMDIPKGLIMDIGGGSTQFIYYSRKHLLNFETIPVGSVVLTDMFKNESIRPEERAQKIEAYFSEMLAKLPWLDTVDPDTQLIGVGGTFRNLGKISRMMKKYPFDMTHNYCVSTGELNDIFTTIKSLDLDKTMKIKGLSQSRADIFPSALAAIEAVVKKLDLQGLVISGSGLREGAMFRYAVPSTCEKPLSDVLGHSVYTTLKTFNENVEHAEQVLNLALQLFKQLKVLHKLPRTYVKVLRTAALLHDTGNRIKYYNHHKHSYYVILNSNLYGISHKDIILSGFVAGLHRKGEILRQEYAIYKDMFSEEDIEAMQKLGVILRIAESLDRSMCGVIKTISCDVLGDSVIMKTEAEGDCALEIKDAMEAGPDFQRAFKKNLEIL